MILKGWGSILSCAIFLEIERDFSSRGMSVLKSISVNSITVTSSFLLKPASSSFCAGCGDAPLRRSFASEFVTARRGRCFVVQFSVDEFCRIHQGSMSIRLCAAEHKDCASSRSASEFFLTDVVNINLCVGRIRRMYKNIMWCKYSVAFYYGAISFPATRRLVTTLPCHISTIFVSFQTSIWCESNGNDRDIVSRLYLYEARQPGGNQLEYLKNTCNKAKEGMPADTQNGRLRCWSLTPPA